MKRYGHAVVSLFAGRNAGGRGMVKFHRVRGCHERSSSGRQIDTRACVKIRETWWLTQSDEIFPQAMYFRGPLLEGLSGRLPG